jgi:RHS repeat-associated protein
LSINCILSKKTSRRYNRVILGVNTPATSQFIPGALPGTGSIRVAIRVVDGAANPTYWLLNDQLGSTAITSLSPDAFSGTDASGALTAELRFKAWGEQRYASGTTPTTYRYTGQREQSQLSIYFYGARWYDPYLNRWIQPDTIIPQNQGVQAWDRYAYANNNPLAYTDPTGHVAWFVSGAIGAAIGGIVGGALYYANNRDSCDWGECGAAAGAGALAGGLIGSGVGLLAAPATSAALATAATAITGAGTGAAGSAIGYTVTNQESFNTSSFVETTAIGGAVGGISAAIPVSGLGIAAKTATYIAGSETLYALQTNNWTVQGATQAAVYGGFGAAFDVGGSLAVQSFGSQALSNVYSSSGPKGYIPPKGFGDIVRTAARYRSGAALIKTGSGLISGVGSSITSWLLSQRLKAE